MKGYSLAPSLSPLSLSILNDRSSPLSSSLSIFCSLCQQDLIIFDCCLSASDAKPAHSTSHFLPLTYFITHIFYIVPFLSLLVHFLITLFHLSLIPLLLSLLTPSIHPIFASMPPSPAVAMSVHHATSLGTSGSHFVLLLQPLAPPATPPPPPPLHTHTHPRPLSSPSIHSPFSTSPPFLLIHQ